MLETLGEEEENDEEENANRANDGSRRARVVELHLWGQGIRPYMLPGQKERSEIQNLKEESDMSSLLVCVYDYYSSFWQRQASFMSTPPTLRGKAVSSWLLIMSCGLHVGSAMPQADASISIFGHTLIESLSFSMQNCQCMSSTRTYRP